MTGQKKIFYLNFELPSEFEYEYKYRLLTLWLVSAYQQYAELSQAWVELISQ